MYAIAEKQNKKRDSLYYQCRAFLLVKKYDKVVDLLENKRIVKKDLQLFKFYIISLFKSGFTEKLKRVVPQGRKLFPNDIDIKVYAGLLLNINGAKSKALKYFGKMLKQYPKNFNIIVTYADILSENKDKLSEVIKLYEKALLVDPSNTSYRYKLAEMYRKGNDMQREMYHRGIQFLYQQQLNIALETLLRVKETDHKGLLNYFLGMIYSLKNNSEEAIKYYKNAIKEDSKMVKAYLELAYVFVKGKKYSKAIKLLDSFPVKNKEINSLKKFIMKM